MSAFSGVSLLGLSLCQKSDGPQTALSTGQNYWVSMVQGPNVHKPEVTVMKDTAGHF